MSEYETRVINDGDSPCGQLPTPEGVGLSVDSRTSRSRRKAPRPLRSKSGLSEAAFSAGVGAARSTSPTSGLADGQPVHPGTSAPDGRVLQFVPNLTKTYALPPTAKAGGLPRPYRCETAAQDEQRPRRCYNEHWASHHFCR